MKIRIWGARGSIPSPLRPDKVEEKICQAILGLPDIDTDDVEAIRAYIRELPPLVRGTAGGNTSCVEIQAGEETFILDAGSGLRELGLELMKGPCGRGQGTLHLFISHPHWDHIQGFPMFDPAFVPGNRIFIYGIHDLKMVLEDQQRPLNWPVSLSDMQAEIEFIPLQVGQPFSIGKVRINTIKNTHPGESYSYRFKDQHSVLVYATDAEYKQLNDASVQPRIEFFRNADVLIFDAQYTLKEAWRRIDWGHSSAMIGVDLARAAGVKKLLLFHYAPAYSDAQLQGIRSTAIAYQAQDTTRPTCEVTVAYEGLTLDLAPSGAADLQLLPGDEAAILTPTSVFDERGVEQLIAHLAEQGRPTSPIIDLSQVETLTTASLKLLITLPREKEGAPIVLAAPSDSVRQVIKLAGYLDYFAIYPAVEIALAAVQAREALNLPGQVVKGRYQIEGKVADGWLGTVLKATDTHTGRTVALKILSPTFSEETVARFMRQARQIINLDHRNIVRAFEWDRDGDHTFMVEEFMAGQALHDLLAHGDLAQSRPPLSANQAVDIVMNIARALEYAHSRGVIHGDLKPRNIFLTDDGVKVSGFGLGRLEEGRNLLDAPLLFLTTACLAPEQILGQPLDARADLYALGVILYQLFTGRPPFVGSDQEVMQGHLYSAPVSPRELDPLISPSLEHLLLKLLDKNPNRRYASAQQTRRILSSLATGADETTLQRRTLLVGREKPLRGLRDCWEKARAGQGQLAFITGEPGIGKTSLAEQSAAANKPPVLLVGHCQEHAGNPPYHLFSQVLRAYFATIPPEFLDEKARRLLGNFTRLVPEIRQMLPDLPVPPPLEPEQEQLRLIINLTQFIKRATHKRPWLLVLDDLQWADLSSLELLRYLSRHLPSMALMIIGTCRDIELEAGHPLLETLHGLSNYPTYHHFPLSRLAQKDVSQVLANMWQQPVPAAFTAKIYQHTEGNPFYVEEVAKGLVDDGLVIWREGKWHFPTLEKVRLPPSVQEAVWRRIGHLGRDTQTLLRQAAVLGQVFRFDDLREMSGLSECQVLERLDAALERQLVQEVRGDTELCFCHAEIHQVLYADLSPLRHRLLHRQAGESLERRAQPEPERFAEELAHHFDEAGEFKRAIGYSIEAARQAQAAYANEAALSWYKRTLEMLDQLGPEEAARFESLQLSAHVGLGEVSDLVSRYDEALEHYASARAILEAKTLETAPSRQRSVERSRRSLADLCRQTARVCERRGEYDRALEWLEKGLSYLDENEPSVEIVRIYNLSSWVHTHQGEYEAAQTLLERALGLAQTAHLRKVEAESLRSLGVVCWYLGDYAGTKHNFEQSLLIYRELGDRRGESVMLNNLGVASGDRGDYAEASAYFEQALLICREIGDRQGEGRALNNLGDIFQRHGDYAKARAYFEQPLLICREIGDRRGEGLALGNLGLLSHHLGDDEAAREYCQQALLILQEIGNQPNQGYVLTYLSHALAGLGLVAEAADAYRQALTLRRELGELYLTMEPLAGLARVALAQGDLIQAQAHVDEILGYLETNNLDGTEEPFRVYLTCYRVLRASQDPRAQDILNTAHHSLQEQAAQISDQEMQRSFLENVTAHQEIVNEFGNKRD